MATTKEKAHYNMPNKGNINSVQGNESREERYYGRNGIWCPGKCPINEWNRFPKKVDYNNLNPADKKCAGYECRREGEPEKFKRTFVVFIQKCFLLPTTVSVTSPIHKPPIFHVDNIRKWNWTKHLLNFLMKGVENKKKGKKQFIDGCIFVLMLIYFHETKFSRPFAPDAPPASWVAHWTRQMMLERISSEAIEPLLPSRTRKAGCSVSLTSSVIEELIKDDYVYEVSNKDPAKEQQQQSKEPLVAHIPLEQQEQPCKEPTAQQSEQEAPVDVCHPEPKKQDVMVSLTSYIIEEFFKDDDVYKISDEEEQQQSQEPSVAWKSEKETLILSSFDSAAQPRERKDERPSFNLGIRPPASQSSQPSQLSVSQLKILEEAVVDAGVTAALNFAEATTSEPTLPASENFMLGTYGESYIDKSTNMVYRFDIEHYLCQFAMERIGGCGLPM
ncbi:hypothetical protein Ahy_B06g085208 [Arachis hypogaea]|uniref:Uncharacterized protein n=1 Tax=Arachis hypogaea TaxID=3818 RepID=A0A444YTU7_ARAHY|nr:hypothetical protein Ahy_B06g085208 [Arachis hypogaea]